MSRYRFVTRTYPVDYWAAHGEEILETADELHGGRWSWRESRQLFANGLRTRSLVATGGSLQQVFVQGLVIAIFVLMLQFGLAIVLHWLGEPYFVDGTRGWQQVAAVVALFALSVSTRWPVLVLVGLALVPSGDSLAYHWTMFGLLCIGIAVVARQGDGRRVVSPTLLAVSVGVFVGFWFLVEVGPLSPMPVLLLVGIAILRLDPRLAAATAVYAAFTAVSIVQFAIVELGAMEPTHNAYRAAAVAVAASGILAWAVVRSNRRLRTL